MDSLFGWIIIIAIVVSSFVGISEDWTFKRVGNLINLPNHNKTSDLVDLLLKNNRSVTRENIRISFNRVIIKQAITSKPLTAEGKREYERDLAKTGGIVKLKEHTIKDIAGRNKHVDLLQQGLEIEMIFTDTKDVLADIVITYEDITDYWDKK